MSGRRRSASRQKAESPSAVSRIAAATTPLRSLFVLLCLLGRNAAEGIGIASSISPDHRCRELIRHQQLPISGYIHDIMLTIGMPIGSFFGW